MLLTSNVSAQVIIKERIEINPGDSVAMNPVQSGCVFGNCSYDYCDSSQIYILFTPASVEPGGRTIMKLWVTPNQYEYNEDNYDILQKTITIEPESGQLTDLGGGEYMYTAFDTLTVDSIVVTVNYENYNQFCSGWNAMGERLIVKDNFDCINCPIPFLSTLSRYYATGQLIIKWDSLYVEADPSELFPGDTANIIIKKRLPDGTLIDFDSTQTYEATMLEGCILGNILVDDSLDVYFYDVNQPIKFVADTSSDSTGLVLLRIGLVEETLLSKSNNNDEADVFDCLPGPPQTTKYKIVQTEVNEEPKIMLGEMKYYGVKKKTVNGSVTEIKIGEIKVGQDSIPIFPSNLTQGWSWIQDNTIWSGRPINIQTHGQSPIFYDKFYANIYYTDTTKPVINNLPQGMIRVIGRYLGKTPDNKVKLFTTQYQSSFTDTLEIQVIRPAKLGNDILSITGPTKVNYVDSTYNIDSLVINISGELGIPPQFLMGIVEQESPNGLGYRYEPFSDMLSVQKNFNSNHRYWIENETNLGDPPIPHHNNIEDERGPLQNYPGFITIWDIFNEKNAAGGPKMYTLGVYTHMKEDYWLPYKKGHFKILTEGGLDSLVAEDSSKILADTSYIKFLRDSAGGIGMYGTPAQTRICASYGFMQLTYFGAVKSFKKKWDLRYPDNNSEYLPEYIMIPPINIVYGSKHLLGKLREVLPSSIKYPNEDTWPFNCAFELSYWNAFLNYNGGRQDKYPNWIFSHAKNNLPEKN